MGTPIEDRAAMATLLARDISTPTVAGFVAGPGIERLDLAFDIHELRAALNAVTAKLGFAGAHSDAGFGAIAMTRRPGANEVTENDLSGRYWLRRLPAGDAGSGDSTDYVEEPHEDVVDEAEFSELTPEFAGTYFEHVFDELRARFALGRIRVLSKDVYNCNSWHRDPEPRLHLPIITNPGSLFVVNHHCTHLPADGSVYFTDTRGYHTALNGGPGQRVHLVAALPQGDPSA